MIKSSKRLVGLVPPCRYPFTAIKDEEGR